MKKFIAIAALVAAPLSYASSDEVPAPEYIQLSPEECVQVATLVALNSYNRKNHKTGKVEATENAQTVAKYIEEHNDLAVIDQNSPEEILQGLAEACYASQGKTEVPVVH